jgi:N-acetylglucosamine kinase-like BadF-type ATPase
MSIYIAIDAGQTHTECVAVNRAGMVVGSGSSGPSYVQGGSMVVQPSFDEAIAALNVMHANVRVVLVGATGGHIPGRLKALHAYMRRCFAHAHIEVIPDGEFVLRSYVGDSVGGVLIAGTGSVAIGSFAGQQVTVGGYGYLFGDEGAGSWLVLEYIRRRLRLADKGMPPDELTTAMCKYWGVDDIRHIPGVLYAHGAIDVSAIAKAAVMIVQAAAEGNALADQLMRETSVELAGLAGRLAHALHVSAGTTFPLYLVGGVWRAHAMLLPGFRDALLAEVQWKLKVVDTSPTLAAAHYARRLHG